MSTRENLFPTYAPPPINFVKGEGVWLTDDRGDKYLDFISGISVNTLGHAHPDLVKALTVQANKLWHLSNMFDVPGQQELADKYCSASFADRVFFANSGSEAVELTLKTARRYHYDRGDEKRIKIIGFDGSFHGRTYAAVNASGNPKYLKGFGPRLPGYVQLPFGDHDALQVEMDDTVAAVIIEPVQGEGGLRPVPGQCLQGLRKLCDEHGALLIYDEVQCGAGRTGKLFAHQWFENAQPDLIACAKGVGGGFPLGFTMATEAVGKVMVPGTHGSTYGGNALAMAVGLAVFEYLGDPEFYKHLNSVAAEFEAGLENMAQQKYPDMIEGVRGKGLLIGLKLKVPNMDVRTIARDDHHFLIGTAGDNVIRMAPALNVTHDECKQALTKLDDVFAQMKSAAKTG
ncbi:aspartate aminotransferase family protein [Robiginitomaculum antarcticum]|uniref:aspartate aminotransferase family protein n=1 Tax=Robiginitomaculum antarcticum TaxID=437507 RepID=UPI00037772D6|nr:aspartate aminotransferase family protein [Robiginitomaculum antarcticum]